MWFRMPAKGYKTNITHKTYKGGGAKVAKQDLTQMSAYVTSEQRDKLRATAKEKGCSVAKLVRDLIDDYEDQTTEDKVSE